MNSKKRGFCAIGVLNGKCEQNIGTLWRSAHFLDAQYIFTIGKRYKKQATDTSDAAKHIPLFEYEDFDEFILKSPKNAEIVLIEQSDRHNLGTFVHPENVIYVLGAEDSGIPEEYFKGNIVLNIPNNGISSFNVAVSGSLVLFDRYIKR